MSRRLYKISSKVAKEILPERWRRVCRDRLRPLGWLSEEVEVCRGGKSKLQDLFVGQLMKKAGGKADPKMANQILS